MRKLTNTGRVNVCQYLLTPSNCSSKTQLLTLYFLDSGAYANGKWDLFGLFHGTEYDWIHSVSDAFLAYFEMLLTTLENESQDQTDWFLEQSCSCSSLFTTSMSLTQYLQHESLPLSGLSYQMVPKTSMEFGHVKTRLRLSRD